MGGQVWDLNPGQNEKSTLVGDQMEVFLSGVSTPSYKTVPDCDVVWSRRPGQTGNGPPIGKGHVFEVFSNGLAVAQIVMLADETVAKLLLCSPSDLLKGYGQKGTYGAMDWRLINGDPNRGLAVGQGIGRSLFGGRQLDASLGLQEQEQAATEHVFEGAIGLPPIPCPAELLGNEAPAGGGMCGDDLLNQGNIGLGDSTSAICCDDLHDMRQYTVSWSGTQVCVQTFFRKNCGVGNHS
jgi:hypothetical protein